MKEKIINRCICGGKAEVQVTSECFGHGDYAKKAYVKCSACSVKIGDIYDREIPEDEIVPKAIDLWNRHNPCIEELSLSWPFSTKEWLNICSTSLYARRNLMSKRKAMVKTYEEYVAIIIKIIVVLLLAAVFLAIFIININ